MKNETTKEKVGMNDDGRWSKPILDSTNIFKADGNGVVSGHHLDSTDVYELDSGVPIPQLDSMSLRPTQLDSRPLQ